MSTGRDIQNGLLDNNTRTMLHAIATLDLLLLAGIPFVADITGVLPQWYVGISVLMFPCFLAGREAIAALSGDNAKCALTHYHIPLMLRTFLLFNVFMPTMPLTVIAAFRAHHVLKNGTNGEFRLFRFF